MSHLYAGEPDGRQALEPIKVSRFRPKYRQLTDQEKALHDAIKAKASELEDLFEQAERLRFPDIDTLIAPIPEGETGAAELTAFTFDPAWEYFQDGMKNLELAVMWTVKGLTS